MIKRLEELIDVPRDQWPPGAAPGGSRCATRPISGWKTPEHESRGSTSPASRSVPAVVSRSTRSASRPSGPCSTKASSTRRKCSAGPNGGFLWRRVAAGLSRQHHDEIYRRIAPFLLPESTVLPGRPDGPSPSRHELAEMSPSRRQPGAVGSRGQGGTRAASHQGAVSSNGTQLPALVPGTPCLASHFMDLPTPWSATRPWSGGSISCSPGNTRLAARQVTRSPSLSLALLRRPGAATCPTPFASKCWPVSNFWGPISRPPPRPRVPRAGSRPGKHRLGDALPIGLRLREENTQVMRLLILRRDLESAFQNAPTRHSQ